MSERSAAALHWLVLILALWVLTRLLPATGARRKTLTATRRPMNRADVHDQVRLVVRIPAQRRSPYSTDREPLDGSESRLSRPYLPALPDSVPEADTTPRTARVRPYWTVQERAMRWRRQRMPVPAAYFRLGLDTQNIHTVPAGGGVR